MVTDGFKRCPKCESTQPVDNFYKIKRKCGDGYSGYCKRCTAAGAIAWQKTNPEADAAIRQRRLETIKLERANWPEEKKEALNRKSQTWRKNNLERSRQIQRDAKYRAAAKDPETFRAKNAMHANRRRCNLQGYPSDITVDDWKKLLEVFDRKCPFCGGKPDVFDLDHLIPIHLGGFNVVGNIVPICRPCNAQKNRKRPSLFALEMKADLAEIVRKAKIRESPYQMCADLGEL